MAVLKVTSRGRAKNSKELWPEGTGGPSKMTSPCTSPETVFMSQNKAVSRPSAGKSAILVNHLHQDCDNSVSENRFKLGKIGISCWLYFLHVGFTEPAAENGIAKRTSRQQGEPVVTALAVAFVNASQNKMHCLDFQIWEIRITYLCRGSNPLPSISFPRCLFWWSGTTKAWHVGHSCLNKIDLLSPALQSR